MSFMPHARTAAPTSLPGPAQVILGMAAGELTRAEADAVAVEGADREGADRDAATVREWLAGERRLGRAQPPEASFQTCRP